jgi:5-methylcytosine-specific restriction endonuclease McrA
MSTTVKMQRDEILTALYERDGDICMYPGCNRPLDIVEIDGEVVTDGVGKLEVTIDHWIPQSYGFENGWTMDQIWDLDNLKLMHKECNAKKGDLLPNADGSLPEKPVTQRERRADKSNRPEVCLTCNSGRLLLLGEVCGVCGSGPMPEAFPQYLKVKSTECDHKSQWCWACSIGYVERVPAFVTALDGEYLDEDFN